MGKVTIKAVDNVKPMDEKTRNKYEFNKIVANVKQTYKNVETFISAVSLMVVSAYAGSTAYTHQFAMRYSRETVLFCSALIALQGALLFWKHINHKK